MWFASVGGEPMNPQRSLIIVSFWLLLGGSGSIISEEVVLLPVRVHNTVVVVAVAAVHPGGSVWRAH